MISKHYQDSLRKNLYKIIISTEFLGNPLKFFKTMRNGFSDFKNLPLEGKEREGAKGFMKGSFWGTVSLFKSTIEGTFGYAQTLTGSLSKILLVIAQDEDYLGSREEKLLTEKPRDVVEGVGFGCQTAVDSIKSGIFGIVKRPYIESKRRGGWGLAKGIYSGISGTFCKPMSGGFDLISKSAEGVKNTVKIFEA